MQQIQQKYEQLASQLCDAHVHVGFFKRQVQFTPAHVIKKLAQLHLKKWVVSSTSTGLQPLDIVKKEINEVLELSEQKCLLQLWVTPDMLKKSPDLSSYFFAPFKGLKIHGYRDDWPPTGVQIYRVFEIAQERRLPILLHTGGRDASEAGAYRQIAEKFGDVTVILGHGRPVEQAIPMLLTLPNVWVDTAFMPIEDIRLIIQAGRSDKILFGSDFPLDEFFYPGESSIIRYRSRVLSFAEHFGSETLLKWGNENFYNVFSLDSTDIE